MIRGRRLVGGADLGRRVDGPQGEVEVIRILRQVGPSPRRGQARREGRLQRERRGCRFELVAVGRAIDVDPEQVALAEPFRQALGEVDVAVVAVRVVQARPRAAVC